MLLISSYAYADSTNSKVELVEKLMETYELTRTLSTFTSTYTAEAKRLYNNVPNTFWESKEYSNAVKDYEETLWNGWRQAYIEYLTEEELKQILAFAETPLGKKFLMMQKNMEPIFTDIAGEANAKLNDKFAHLMQQFQNRQLEKSGQFQEDSGAI